MKKLFVILLSSLSIVWTACKSDEVAPELNETYGFTLDGMFYSTPHILIENIPIMENGLHQTGIVLLSKNLGGNPAEGTTGYAVFLRFSSQVPGIIDPGTYELSEEPSLNSFTHPLVVLEYTPPGSFSGINLIKGGTVIVGENAGNITLEYSLQKVDEVTTINGHYGIDK